MRTDGRTNSEVRSCNITRQYLQHPEGSVLITMGNTKVLCNATIISGVPRFLKNSGRGWLTAEYAMLPCATVSRNEREVVRGRQSGRSQEIQRLIGRSLRNMIDWTQIGENTIIVDCDVLQADGGTRAAAITGGCVAVIDAVQRLPKHAGVSNHPLTTNTRLIKTAVAAISVGIIGSTLLIDPDYLEDTMLDADINLVMNDAGQLIEIQGSAERQGFTVQQLDELIGLAQPALQSLFAQQRSA